MAALSAFFRRRWIVTALLAVAVAAVVVVAVATHARSPQLPANQQLRWLDIPAGSPRSIADENSLPGTRSWQVAASNISRLALYVSSQSAKPGDTERVYVNSAASTVSLSMYRMGWYGGQGGRLVLDSGSVPLQRQPPCAHSTQTGLTECRWIPTASFQLPTGLTSGVYIIKARDTSANEREAILVVEPTQPPAALVQVPLATYEAYNGWGGDSLYPASEPVGVTRSKQGVEVSFDRPYDGPTGAGEFFNADVATVRFLEQRGYPVGYSTSTSIDSAPQQVQVPRLVVDAGHSEYWSQSDLQAFVRARDGGTNLVFLSSDTAAWRVRFAPATDASSEAGTANHRIIAYKEYASLDPDHGNPTGAFADKGAGLTGSAYSNCITPRVRAPGVPTYRYYHWQPNPALQPAWLFQGTGLRPNSQIAGVVGYELDRVTPASPRDITTVGGGRAPCMTRGAPDNADSTLYRAPSGATVFASGTLGWQLGLSPVTSASPDAPHEPNAGLVRLTQNLLDALLAGHPQP